MAPGTRQRRPARRFPASGIRESHRKPPFPHPRVFHCPGAVLKISDRSFCKVFPRTTMISLELLPLLFSAVLCFAAPFFTKAAAPAGRDTDWRHGVGMLGGQDCRELQDRTILINLGQFCRTILSVAAAQCGRARSVLVFDGSSLAGKSPTALMGRIQEGWV